MAVLQLCLLLMVATTSVSTSCMSSSTMNYLNYIDRQMQTLHKKYHLPSCAKHSQYKYAAANVAYYGKKLQKRIAVLLALRLQKKSWKKYNGHCYLFVRQSTAWDPARKICIKMGADLVTIDNSYEYGWLKKNMGGYSYWSGLKTTTRNNNLKWSKTGKTPSYNNFKSRYSNVCPRKCVYITSSYWYFTSCSSTSYYICEKSC